MCGYRIIEVLNQKKLPVWWTYNVVCHTTESSRLENFKTVFVEGHIWSFFDYHFIDFYLLINFLFILNNN